MNGGQDDLRHTARRRPSTRTSNAGRCASRSLAPRLSDAELIAIGIAAGRAYHIGTHVTDLRIVKVPSNTVAYRGERESERLPHRMDSDVVELKEVRINTDVSPTVRIGYSHTLRILVYTDPIFP